MRPLLLFASLLVLAACTESSATRVGENTFKIEGPQCFTCGDAPNKRLADRLCHGRGFIVLDQVSQKGGPDRATDSTDPMTIWTIKCIQ